MAIIREELLAALRAQLGKIKSAEREATDTNGRLLGKMIAVYFRAPADRGLCDAAGFVFRKMGFADLKEIWEIIHFYHDAPCYQQLQPQSFIGRFGYYPQQLAEMYWLVQLQGEWPEFPEKELVMMASPLLTIRHGLLRRKLFHLLPVTAPGLRGRRLAAVLAAEENRQLDIYEKYCNDRFLTRMLRQLTPRWLADTIALKLYSAPPLRLYLEPTRPHLLISLAIARHPPCLDLENLRLLAQW